MTAPARFAALVRASPVPLAEACTVAAGHLGHPASVESVAKELDGLAAGVVERVGVAPPTLDDVAQHLFGAEAFAGDRVTYDDPANSLLPAVLERRRGMPITLAIVVIEVAGRVGVDATGVGMPGHFLVGEGAAPTRWLDGFDGGRWLDLPAARARFLALHGPDATFDPAFLQATPRPQIVARVLANLANSFRRRGDASALLRSLELRRAIPGAMGPRAEVELAEAYAAVGRVTEAIGVLEPLVERLDPRRRPVIEDRILALRSSFN